MADRRIQIPQRHEGLVDRLRQDGSATDSTGPFETMADVLVFAAAWAVSQGQWSRMEPGNRDPIRPEVFSRRAGYETLIHLLAFHRTKDMTVLANNTEMEQKRAEIFEGYIQAGLDSLESRLRSETDYTEAILTLTKVEAAKIDREPEELDIREFLGD